MVEDADIFARAVELILQGRDAQARLTLATLAVDDPLPRYEPLLGVDAARAIERGTLAPKERVTNAMRVSVFKRDGWRCRYCGRKIVLRPVLRLLTTLCPGFKGLLPGDHMPREKTEPAVGRVYPNLDHFHAVSRGGAWIDPNNHVTACTPCNEHKGDRLWRVPGEPVRDGWDGMAHACQVLAELHPDLVKSHYGNWLRALRAAN